MKKKIFGGIAVLAIAVVAAWNVNVNSRTNGMSDVMLANVEALAQQEGGSSGSFTCYSTYNNCWFWNCSTIYRCGNPCSDASADSYSAWYMHVTNNYHEVSGILREIFFRIPLLL